MNEASKTRRKFGRLEERIFAGEGIDIGCGGDPVFPEARPFDVGDGDANRISKYVDRRFDYVFSSHCLEHMMDPFAALGEWWGIVKPGGYLYAVVPDEDLYEQGTWPSAYNRDHKHTFTIHKTNSWSPVSVNVLDLIATLEDAEVLKIELQDDFYDYSPEALASGRDQTLGEASAQIVFALRKSPDGSRRGSGSARPPLFRLHKLLLYLRLYASAPFRRLRKSLSKRISRLRAGRGASPGGKK